MGLKRVSILLTLFIFGIIFQAWADSVKSMHHAAHQETIMKMDEIEGIMRKNTGPAKEPIQSSKKRNARIQSVIPYSNHGAVFGDIKPDVNFLKAVEEKKRPPLTECLGKLIFPYDFVQNVWRDKFQNFTGVAEAKSPNPDTGRSNFASYPTGNKYFEEGRTLEPFKLLQSKKEELFKEIFMGFRFSFSPMNGHVHLDMNATPSLQTETGIIISFRPASAP